jgi:hypothetical protein
MNGNTTDFDGKYATPADPLLCEIAEAAHMLRRGSRTIRRLMAKGLLERVELGGYGRPMVTRCSLLRLVQRSIVPPTPRRSRLVPARRTSRPRDQRSGDQARGNSLEKPGRFEARDGAP